MEAFLISEYCIFHTLQPTKWWKRYVQYTALAQISLFLVEQHWQTSHWTVGGAKQNPSARNLRLSSDCFLVRGILILLFVLPFTLSDPLSGRDCWSHVPGKCAILLSRQFLAISRARIPSSSIRSTKVLNILNTKPSYLLPSCHVQTAPFQGHY